SRFPNQTLYLPGDVVMLTATNGRYSGFQGWSDGNTNAARAITVGFTNVFTAIFTNTVPLEELVFQEWDRSFGGRRSMAGSFWADTPVPVRTVTRPVQISASTIIGWCGWTPTGTSFGTDLSG